LLPPKSGRRIDVTAKLNNGNARQHWQTGDPPISGYVFAHACRLRAAAGLSIMKLLSGSWVFCTGRTVSKIYSLRTAVLLQHDDRVDQPDFSGTLNWQRLSTRLHSS
jgi:hypothetical protein